MTRELIQVGLSFLGSMGFGYLFGIHDRRLFLEGLGGALGWGIYLIAREGGLSVFWGLFLGSAGVALMSEILARRLRTPAIILMVPMLIPMIPGGDLYYTMHYLINHNDEKFVVTARLVSLEAAAIAVGILFISYIAGVMFRVRAVKEGTENRRKRLLSWHQDKDV